MLEKQTAGADETPWMLRKPRVLKKHLLDAEKVPDAGKNTFSMLEKSTAPCGVSKLFSKGRIREASNQTKT